MTTMTSLSTTPSDLKKDDVPIGELVVASIPRTAPYVMQVDDTTEPNNGPRKYRCLRISLIVLCSIAGVLSLASTVCYLVLGILATSDSADHGYYEGGIYYDYSMEEQMRAFICMGCALYCLVVMLVCLILTVKSPDRVLAPGCGNSACLGVTVMIGVLASFAEGILPAVYGDATAALGLARFLVMIPYFVIIIVCACKFNDRTKHQLN